MKGQSWQVSPDQFLSDTVRKALDGVVSGQHRASVLHSAAGKVPAHLQTISTEHGTVVYDPKKIKARGIRRAIKFGRFHEISGLQQKPNEMLRSGLKMFSKSFKPGGDTDAV